MFVKHMESQVDRTITLADGFFQAIGEEEASHRLNVGDYAYLVSLPFPKAGPRFKERYQAAEMLSKYPFDIGVDRAAVALAKFQQSERACAAMNSITPHLDRYTAPTLLKQVRGKIKAILGEFCWKEVAENCGHGKGASRSLSRTRGASYYKFGPRPTVTLTCLPVAAQVMFHLMPGYWGNLVGHGVGDPAIQLLDHVTICQASMLTTVPKNAKTDRVICIEPTLNMFFQKGIGKVIRNRLRRQGLNLNNQQPINRELARLGSLYGHLATIDLSSASDSIALGLAEFVLPADWFDAISRTRSDRCVLPNGEYHSLEKVSSMGNGNTFELESLIFLALCLVVCPNEEIGRSIAVYGDDLIVPADKSGAVIRGLDLLGFTTNVKKTFCDGPFRESCGKHYYNGEDVTPIYIKEPIDSIARYCWFANSVLRASLRDGWRDATYRGLHDLALSVIPAWVHKRCLIPDGVGDGGIVVPFDQACPSRAPGQMEGWRYSQFIPINKTWEVDGRMAVVASMFKLETLPDQRTTVYSTLNPGVETYRPGVPAEQRVAWAKVKCCFTSHWSAIGPWY